MGAWLLIRAWFEIREIPDSTSSTGALEMNSSSSLQACPHHQEHRQHWRVKHLTAAKLKGLLQYVNSIGELKNRQNKDEGDHLYLK